MANFLLNIIISNFTCDPGMRGAHVYGIQGPPQLIQGHLRTGGTLTTPISNNIKIVPRTASNVGTKQNK